MAKNAIYSQAIIIEDRFTEKISHRQEILCIPSIALKIAYLLQFLCFNMTLYCISSFREVTPSLA